MAPDAPAGNLNDPVDGRIEGHRPDRFDSLGDHARWAPFPFIGIRYCEQKAYDTTAKPKHEMVGATERLTGLAFPTHLVILPGFTGRGGVGIASRLRWSAVVM